MATLTIDEMKNEIKDGKMFSVVYVKKTNGEIRKMTARRGVRVGVKNAEGKNGSWNRKENDELHNLITVYDVNKLPDDGELVLLDEEGKPVNPKHKGAFRRINLDGLISAKIHGINYKYDEDKKILVGE